MTDITINTCHKLRDVSPLLYGIFFEDINYAGDGGLYGELIANRSFEYYDRDGETDKSKMCWETIGNGNLSVSKRFPLSQAHSHYGRLSGEAGDGIRNLGFCGEGLAVREGEVFLFSCYARNASPMKLTVRLADSRGTCFGQKTFSLVRTGRGWTKYRLTFTADGCCNQVFPEILLETPGAVDLDLLSLFPQDTFLGRKNGMRRDLAQMLQALSPKFMRFPGGCIVEGRSFENMYCWKDTIGDLTQRPTNWNRWQMEEYQIHGRSSEDYFQSYGLGFYEYFQFCEDIGAKPVPVINAGMTCQWHEGLLADMKDLHKWIQDTLDLIEFANGDAQSEWGARRAAMGHPEPFGLEYIGIGNEQWGTVYFERYEAFQKVLSKEHPEIKLITCAGWTGEGKDFDTAYTWLNANKDKAYAVDEHFYKPPQWFLENIGRYDNYDRTLPKVFAGEYAAHSSPDTAKRVNNWQTALCEAAFLTGIERNADHVAMTCYAPLLARTGHNQWQPNLIWFDNTSVYGTPSYHVQKLFSNHTGATLVETRAKSPLPDTLKTVSSLSRDGKHLYCKLVNLAEQPEEISLRLEVPRPAQTDGACTCSCLTAELDAVNTHRFPENVVPQTRDIFFKNNILTLSLPMHSVTVLDFYSLK